VDAGKFTESRKSCHRADLSVPLTTRSLLVYGIEGRPVMARPKTPAFGGFLGNNIPRGACNRWPEERALRHAGSVDKKHPSGHGHRSGSPPRPHRRATVTRFDEPPTRIREKSRSGRLRGARPRRQLSIASTGNSPHRHFPRTTTRSKRAGSA